MKFLGRPHLSLTKKRTAMTTLHPMKRSLSREIHSTQYYNSTPATSRRVKSRQVYRGGGPKASAQLCSKTGGPILSHRAGTLSLPTAENGGERCRAAAAHFSIPGDAISNRTAHPQVNHIFDQTPGNNSRLRFSDSSIACALV